MHKKYDALLKVVKGTIPFWNIMIFCYVWALYYNERTAFKLWSQTMLISAFLYIVIYLAFGKLYNAFKIGTYRTSELIFSQLLAFGAADLCLYLECCLLHHGVVDIRWGIVAVILQFSGSLFLIIFAKHYFAKYIPPQNTILIYGKDTDVEDFERRLGEKLSHMFIINEACSDDMDLEELEKKLEDYGTILLFQVSEKARVSILAKSIQLGKNVYITPRIEDILLTNFENRHMIDTPLLKAKNDGSEYAGKRLFDILVSVTLLIIFSPFMLIIAICIKLEDSGDIFYKQKRVTKDGKIFEILKFRSMIPDAEKYGVKPCTVKDDRITRVGRVIRATRLDETPQLINILKGDMSLVGPRPERVEHVEKYTAELPEFSYRLRVRGGLTGYAQIYGKYNTSAEDKLKMDLMYIERQSFILDIQLIFLTVKVMFLPESTQGFSKN